MGDLRQKEDLGRGSWGIHRIEACAESLDLSSFGYLKKRKLVEHFSRVLSPVYPDSKCQQPLWLSFSFRSPEERM